MDTLKEVVSSHQLRLQRLRNLRRLISGRALPFLLVTALLLLALIPPGVVTTPVLAAHQGEETAKYLPSDTDLYLTINLDPSSDQLTKFWTFVNNWWQDPNVQAKWGEVLGQIETESDININEDVLPWLGPEIALGTGNLTPSEGEAPEFIVFVGTMDKEASETFFFDKFLPAVVEKGEYLPPGPSDAYNGIDVLYIPEGGAFMAFPQNYIMFSNSQALLEECLDLMATPNISASVAGTADFQSAQAALPATRVGMFYFNCAHMWQQAFAQIPVVEQPKFEPISDYIPSCLAASLAFGSNDIITTAYYPLPEGMTLPTTEPDLLRSTKIVPDDALFFTSGQDMNAIWEQVRSLLVDNWADMVTGGELPSGVVTFDDMITWIAITYGVNIDNDVFSWMTGEYAFAVLSLTSVAGGPVDQLMMFEVENTSEVSVHLATIINGINTMIVQSTPVGETPDTLQTSTTSIDGVSATLITNNAIAGSGVFSSGYLFLDVDTSHYLVIGLTTDALEAAVKASKGEIPSLDEAEAYQGMLSLLSETRISLGYFNLRQIFDTISSDMPGGQVPEPAANLMPLQCALGFSVSLLDSNAVTMTGALYLLPPPLVSQVIPAGTSTVEIPEQTMDFSQLDPDVGQCAVSIDVNITDAPTGANIAITALKELPEDIISGFELAATGAGVSIVDIAYGIRVDKTGLTTDNIGTATITMKVGKTWADAYGVDNVKIFRVSDGTHEALPTEFIDYEGDYAVFEGTSTGGLSVFGLVAVSPLPAGTNWALIGGIIGGVIVVAAIVTVILLRRRRAVA